MVAVRFMLLLCGACGRLCFEQNHEAVSGDDASTAIDQHLQAADGWSIAPLVDLTGIVVYDSEDFDDIDTVTGAVEKLGNDPSYVAALYTPFDASFAVIAGRYVIEIPAEGPASLHSYEPPPARNDGPDAPTQATFANFGTDEVGLWITSDSQAGGDGLYLIPSNWSITRKDGTNNTHALGLDPHGAYDGVGEAALYMSSVQSKLRRRTATGQMQDLPVVVPERPGIIGVAEQDGILYIAIQDEIHTVLERVQPGPSYLVTFVGTANTFSLAEGSTDAGLFALKDNIELVTPDDSSKLVRVAWTDDRDWAWRSVSAPRAGHWCAGYLIVLEWTARTTRLVWC